MNVRTEESADLDAIRKVHVESFPTHLEAQLVDALRDSGRLRVSVVAEEEGNVVGHVAFSAVTLANTTDGAGLGPVAVLSAFRNRGIAEKLIRDGLARCSTLQFGFVVVLGDPHYYRRFGFLSSARWGLSDEFRGGDAFQAMELRPGAIPKEGGLVQYAPEFKALE